eukprot:COSAG06_NODE_61434_length_267_cov_2.392857_1_plen_56_part_10
MKRQVEVLDAVFIYDTLDIVYTRNTHDRTNGIILLSRYGCSFINWRLTAAPRALHA